ncbi:hypothetical protein [Methylobacterium adhaesivum]|uniref:Uncharacterized protein n=1 Tax=Methylobacterium adhaesivum TaxID=333297 RepID=A0ABT8BHM7_9HYPH|nr:hypothetical protein [Methylobacterium adhaesivum]MDN3591619.1 hypothetical protein [Methylobacterium adhaesivum]
MILFVFTEADSPDVTIVLPDVPQRQDASKRIHFALRTLSDLDGISINEVLAAVRRIGSDVIRTRLPDSVVWRGESINLKTAEAFIRRMRRLLLTAAATEVRPERTVQVITSDCEDFVDRCRFAHTFEGSFGFVVEAPVGAPPDVTLLSEEEHPAPFERAVVRRIATGFRSVRRAEVAQNSRPLQATFQGGWSADMCDQVVGMYEEIGAESLSFGIELSTEWTLPEDHLDMWSFTLRPVNIRMIKEASEILKERQEENEVPVIISGPIVRLASKENPADLLHNVSPREVVIRWESPDRGDISVSTRVAPEDYLAALEAHRAGRAVRVSGNLVRAGKRWILYPITSLKVE